MNKISLIFMLIFLLMLLSLILIIKIKQLKVFLYTILNFYSEHLINDKQINGFKYKSPDDLLSAY